jgi:hypothetical protein
MIPVYTLTFWSLVLLQKRHGETILTEQFLKAWQVMVETSKRTECLTVHYQRTTCFVFNNHNTYERLFSLNEHVKVKLSLCLINEALRHEGVRGSRCIDPCFLARRKSPRYSLDRSQGGYRGPYRLRGEEKILDPTGTRTPNPLSSSLYPVAISTALSRLPNEHVKSKKKKNIYIYIYFHQY